MEHLQLLEEVKVAIDKLYSDTSVSQETTLDSLEEICGDLEGRIETLKDELKGSDW